MTPSHIDILTVISYDSAYCTVLLSMYIPVACLSNTHGVCWLVTQSACQRRWEVVHDNMGKVDWSNQCGATLIVQCILNTTSCHNKDFVAGASRHSNTHHKEDHRTLDWQTWTKDTLMPLSLTAPFLASRQMPSFRHPLLACGSVGRLKILELFNVRKEIVWYFFWTTACTAAEQHGGLQN